jgi:hypothetical protein
MAVAYQTYRDAKDEEELKKFIVIPIYLRMPKRMETFLG